MTAAVNSDSSTLRDLLPAWQRSLRATNRSERTVETYSEAVRLLGAWLDTHHRPADVGEITRGDIEGFIGDLLARYKPATAANRYRALARFFAWCVDEDEIAVSPMVKMTPPTVPEQTVPVVSDDDLRRLLAACAGKSFEDRRDTAMIRMLVDTGMRAAELVGLAVDDLDLDLSVAMVLGKGRRPRSCPYGKKTGVALDRYLRERRHHPDSDTERLWLGRRGPMTYAGLRQMLDRRAVQAGLEHLHAHQLRHSFAAAFLAQGGQESDLMMLAGWKSRAMLNRYGAATAAERAREAYRRSGVGDRL